MRRQWAQKAPAGVSGKGERRLEFGAKGNLNSHVRKNSCVKLAGKVEFRTPEGKFFV